MVEQIESELAGSTREIVLVDDGSSDRSWAVIRELAWRYPTLRGISLMRNYGQHNALLAGIRAARGRLIVTIDDDLQHPPREISKLLAELEKGFDVVYGSAQALPHSLPRNLAAWTTKLVLQKAMGAVAARHTSAFRAFRAELRAAFADYRSPYVSIDVLLTWATSRFSFVPVVHRKREVGRSNYTFRTLVRHAITMITGFSTLPLRLASLTGFCFTLLGITVLAWVFAVFLLRGRSVPGFAFLASIIAIFSGAQLFSLGIIGEYLARIHVRAMERPPYAIAETFPASSSVGSAPAREEVRSIRAGSPGGGSL